MRLESRWGRVAGAAIEVRGLEFHGEVGVIVDWHGAHSSGELHVWLRVEHLVEVSSDALKRVSKRLKEARSLILGGASGHLEGLG